MNEQETITLIEAARLQVALDECEALLSGRGWVDSIRRYGAGVWQVEVGHEVSTIYGLDNGTGAYNVTSGPPGPTPLAAVLALRDALKERK
jgi:hypothetical protein